jgi:integrase
MKEGMPKRATVLSAIEVKRLPVGFNPVGGVAGLALVVRGETARSWVLRIKIGGRRRDIGLGAYPEVSLARARERAVEARDKVRLGIDPVRERKRLYEALRLENSRSRSFQQCAEALHKSKSVEFRNAKHSAQWISTLRTYAYPVLENLPVESIELGHITRVLEPIWQEKTETASRVRQRVEAVLAYAIAHGYRKGSNVAAWKGNLDAILPKPQKLKNVQHLKALSLDEMNDFWLRLNAQDGIGARALTFLILCAARSGEVRGAQWDEIDFKAKTWTIPASRMKAGKQHIIPLCMDAITLLESFPRRNDLIFPAIRGGTLSDMTLSAVLKRMGISATVHGFRSSFRDWAAERTAYPREVAEQALAHTIGAVEKAYRRSDLLEKRRRLMDDWERFLMAPSSQSSIVPINRSTKKPADQDA